MELVSQTFGAGKPRLLITAGVHGDEYEPMAALDTLRHRLPAMQIHGTVTLVPVVNAAAFERGDRVAEDGLDLARVCPGTLDGSITQRVAHALSQLIRNADYYVDLHSGGRALKLMPLAGYMLHPDASVLASQRRMARAFNLTLIWGTSPALQGRSLSVARDAGVPAIYVEHGGGGGFDASAVEELVHGCLSVMAQLQIISGNSAPGRVKYTIEDPRPSSGHLQMNYPAPMAGLFQPRQLLGENVRAGQTLGCLHDVITGHCHNVLATEGGLVVMLRAWPRVRTGDALATVVPMEGSQGD
jgi:predicted deacylase